LISTLFPADGRLVLSLLKKIAVNQHFQAAWRILPAVRARVTRRNQEAGKNAAGQIGVLLEPGLRGLRELRLKH